MPSTTPLRGTFSLLRRALGCLALAAMPVSLVRSQTPGAVAHQWRVWAFSRAGAAQTYEADDPIFGLLGGGIAASHGCVIGMIRATANADPRFTDSPRTGMQDYAAMAGARSRADRLFVTGAVGIAVSMPVVEQFNWTPSSGQRAPAFDLSAHADYRLAGVALTLSSVLGPPSIRYVALSFGAELGWFGP